MHEKVPKYVFALLLLYSSLIGQERFVSQDLDSLCRRIQAHLLIGNPNEAVSEARSALTSFHEQPPLYEVAIRSLSEAGEDQEMIKLWEQYYAHFPKNALQQEVLEQLCWGVLKKGRKAPGVASQLISIIGAALTQDMYAVPFLLEGLRHSSIPIRLVCVELASLFGDHPLREEIRRMFHYEPVLQVKLEVMKAVSKLCMHDLLPELMQSVADPKLGAKEKKIAIQAIVNLRDTVSHEELEILASSNRAALRELACEAITHCHLKEEVHFLHWLLNDTHPDVQAAALKGLGVLRIPPTDRVKHLAQYTKEPQVGITAGWVWLLAEPENGKEALGRWLNHKSASVQAKAASALGAAGPYGVSLAKEFIPQSSDPYVKANLALALIGQREETEIACAVLADFLATHPEKCMFVEDGVFHSLQKSSVGHSPAIPNYPEVVNQTVRLELLNLLAILEYPGAQESIKSFLKERHWGVTGLAAETLLGEGDETAIDHVRSLLEDADPHIQAEAALVLATWGKDPTALSYLLEAYPKGDRKLQVKILEALGRIGNRDAIPFLLEQFKEPSLMLRMIVASILLQTLNS